MIWVTDPNILDSRVSRLPKPPAITGGFVKAVQEPVPWVRSGSFLALCGLAGRIAIAIVIGKSRAAHCRCRDACNRIGRTGNRIGGAGNRAGRGAKRAADNRANGTARGSALRSPCLPSGDCAGHRV